VDIGCAIGSPLGWAGGMATNSFLIAKYHPHAVVTGADVDREVIARNEELLREHPVRNLRFCHFDLLSPRGLLPQDVVVMSDVVGNRPGDFELVRSAALVVRQGGHLVLHVPSRHPSERPPKPGDLPDILANGYSEDELLFLLRASGASEISFRRSFGPAARLAGRIRSALLRVSQLAGVILFPVQLLLGVLDLLLPNRDGHGIIAVARIGGREGGA